jgi:hypothetical protein
MAWDGIDECFSRMMDDECIITSSWHHILFMAEDSKSLLRPGKVSNMQ